MRVLGFGTYDTSVHPRSGVLLAGLAARGATVRELDRPLGLTTADRVDMLRRPWLLPRLAARLASRWAGLVDGSFAFGGERAPDVVVVGYLGHFDVLLARALFPRATIVLDHLIFAASTARDRGVDDRVRGAALSALDRMATGAADVVVVDTEEHAELAAPAVRERTVVVPVGATEVWRLAGERRATSTSATPRMVFYGLFTPLQGTVTIARALAELHRRGVPLRVTLVGTGQDHAEARAVLGGVPGIEWVDWVAPDELPDLVAAHDIGLGIFGDTDKGLKVVPNKVYQSLAAGCAVVTSDTPPQRRFLRDAALLVPPGDPAALADALERLLADPERVADLRARARERARDLTPSAVVEPLWRELTS
ncbi:glycosyltransferase family 4 protein [Georgenia sp. Z1344]|uniref:glycosyltransferase family 4 protein n=1 Tax=Georgenia sp. Z1344 TaxID=3416706 RepID=UPI003CF06820